MSYSVLGIKYSDLKCVENCKRYFIDIRKMLLIFPIEEYPNSDGHACLGFDFHKAFSK